MLLIVNDESALKPIAERLEALDTESEVLINPQDLDLLQIYKPNRGVHVLLSDYGDWSQESVVLDRYIDLYMASLGGRFRSDTKHESAMYSGGVPRDQRQIDAFITEGLHADRRAAMFQGYGIKYIGITFSNPHYILVVDNKKGIQPHNPMADEKLSNFLSSLPDGWWQDLAVVSAGSVEKLENFMVDFDHTSIAMTYTNGGRAKLRFMAIEFVDLLEPKATSKYGIYVRESAHRFNIRVEPTVQNDLYK